MCKWSTVLNVVQMTLVVYTISGADPGGGGGGGGGRTRRAPPKIGKNMIFWRIIVIFHTKYPRIFRASLRQAQFFLSAPPPP